MRITKPHIIVLLAALAHLQCGQTGGESDLDKFSYKLARTAVNVGVNTLFIELSKPDEFRFAIDGSGFEADVTKGERLPIQETVRLSFSTAGTYNLNFKLYYKDGSVFLEDTLTWAYSREKPSEPDVSFSEEATNDVDIEMVVPDDLEEETTELWVEGDVAEGEEGWHAIADDHTVALQTSAADGMKTFKVKYRNIFGTESGEQEVEILKKSVGPDDCVLTLNTTVTGTGNVTAYMSATNDGDLYYLISGDVAGASNTYTKFSAEVSKTVAIIDNAAANTIRIQVRDIASNYCPEKTFTVTYDEDHSSTGITVKNSKLWTDSNTITVEPQLDYIPSDTVEMYLHGNIEIRANTFAWVAYDPETDVELTPVNGNRYVRVKYRVNGVETAVKSVAIYLKPFIQVVGASAPYTLSLSEIVDLTSLTITGCTTAYVNIAPTQSVTCTPTGASVSVIYNLSDGTTVTKTSAI